MTRQRTIGPIVVCRSLVTREERRQTATASRETSLRLLVADDDGDYRAYLAALLRRLGFWVDTAVDGVAAIERLSHGHFDVVIVDHEMPRMNGIEAIRQIRGNESTTNVYALMLTGREDIGTKLTALDAGFDDFVTKASSEPELVAKVVAARRLALRQRTMDVAIRDLYGLATRDELTGLFNRRFFISEAERLLTERTPLSIILLDLDGFKEINDRLGHVFGDSVLRDVGTAIQRHTRPEDTVARFGGDEFVILVPHLGLETVSQISERLTRTIDALEWQAPEDFHVGISTGVSTSLLLDSPTLVQLLTIADRDMYKNKWLRKHPDVRPELYEYPASDRDLGQRLLRLK